jgi:hypothetical protein
MEDVFDKIGTNPAMLRKLERRVPAECTLQEFIHDQLRQAEIELVTFPFPAILRALKKSPSGVDIMSLPHERYAGVDLRAPREVGRRMELQPVLYNVAQRQYQLASRAHLTALKTYEPVRRWWG